VQPYEAVFKELEVVTQQLKEKASADPKEPAKKWLVSNKTSWALSQYLGGEECVEVVRSPIEEAKAVKNETERSGMRDCHIRDGAALIKYFSWLEEELQKGTELDEVQAADKLEEFRKTGDNFKGLSFDTISSTGPNAAIIHYKPESGNCSTIDPKAVYLCDSGAQYLDGTTDTTRTLHFGEPTEMEKKAYTLVLKGMVALDRVIFPKGTSGFALDVLARQFLWNEGLDYRHGTGHGVGSFLVSACQKTNLHIIVLTYLNRTFTRDLSELVPGSNIPKSPSLLGWLYQTSPAITKTGTSVSALRVRPFASLSS